MATNFSSNESNDTGPEPFQLYIWPAGVAFLTGGCAALFGNLMIVAALFVSPELQKNRCNILVGNLALADAISSCYLVFCGVQALQFAFAFRQDICYFAHIPAIISFDAGAAMILGIGVDRAISLWRPIYYKNLTVKYIWFANGASWMFGLVNAVVGFFYRSDQEMVPLCVMPTAMREVALQFWNNINIIINILVVTTYAAAYHKAKLLAKNSMTNSNNEQILRKNRLLASLIICVGIYIVGWMLTMGIIFFASIATKSVSIIFHANVYVGVLATFNIGCNFYVYYARSEEYRVAFKKLLGQKISKNGSIAPAHVSVSAVPRGSGSVGNVAMAVGPGRRQSHK